MNDESKKNKIIKGGFYLTIVNTLAQVLAIVVNIVLARLLLPEDFGVVALAMTFIGFITLFTNMGFGSSIIHESETTQKRTVFDLLAQLCLIYIFVFYYSEYCKFGSKFL